MKKSNSVSLQGYVEIEEGTIRIYDKAGDEIVGWVDTEWIEDPEFVVPAIAKAIRVFYEDGEDKLKELIDWRR
jgi:hypothetical protein